MKLNFRKIFIVLVFLFTFIISNVYAIDLFLSNTTSNTDINEKNDVEQNNNNNEIISKDFNDLDELESNIVTYGNNDMENENLEITSSPYNSKLIDSSSSTSTPTITTTANSDNSLSVSDIINIILIAVCIVLIFLAVAILLRCK